MGEDWKSGKSNLWKKLLTQVLGDKNPPNINSNFVWDHLCHRKILIVLDDVREIQQLEGLIGMKNLYGAGSKIIMITRDKNVL